MADLRGTPRSGMYSAGAALLLVGAIIAGVTALAAGFMGFWTAGPIALLFAAVSLAGCVCTLIAWLGTRRDEPGRAWVLGIVGSLLPPLNVVGIGGAILVRLSPEGEQQAQSR